MGLNSIDRRGNGAMGVVKVTGRGRDGAGRCYAEENRGSSTETWETLECGEGSKQTMQTLKCWGSRWGEGGRRGGEENQRGWRSRTRGRQCVRDVTNVQSLQQWEHQIWRKPVEERKGGADRLRKVKEANGQCGPRVDQFSKWFTKERKGSRHTPSSRADFWITNYHHV